MLKSSVVLLLALLSFYSHAGRVINSVNLTPNPALTSDSVLAKITVTGTGSGNNRRWRSTGYQIGNNDPVCIDTSNYESSSAKSDEFYLTGIANYPTTEEVNFVAFKNNNCNGAASTIYSVNLTTVAEVAAITLNPDTIYDTEASINEVVGDIEVTDGNGNPISKSVELQDWNGGTSSGSCPSGAGNNWRFKINNNVLQIANASGSTISPGTYPICVKTSDSKFRSNLYIKVEENTAGVSTDINISSSTIYQGDVSLGAIVGQLTVAAPKYSSNVDFSYNGESYAGNCLNGQNNWPFSIDNNTLKISSLAGDTLPVGDYTICVKTQDNYFQKNITITVLAQSNSNATFLDRFNSQSYGNNDGELDWAGDWLEEDDGYVNSGNVSISNNRLRLRGYNSFIQREVDLSNFTQASLSFDYELETNYYDDEVYIIIRTNDSNNWTLLYTFTGGSDYQGTLPPIDITNYISSDTDIGIFTSNGFDYDDNIYIDNFAVNASGAIEPNQHLYFDRFSQVSYGNNDGELDWDGDWREENDDGNPRNGDITVDSGQLKITNANVSIRREADLSGLTSATLSFDYSSITTASDDIVYLQIRSNNGSWITLEEFVGSSSSNASGQYEVDISNFIATDVDVRFITGSGFNANDAFFVDNFAIDGSVGGECADISAYDLIFDDDFSETTYPLTDTWSAVDFDRANTNVWPNDRIYNTPSENQQILFKVNNQKLQIAGDVSNGGANEYGVLLHDVNSQGYSSSSISEYSIETELYANSSQINNNDVGVVFGYKNESDFYLLRWSKVSEGYASDSVFPGGYRSLDLVWVKDGEPTLLASKPYFYEQDPLSIRITVNDDGISICINGIEVLTYQDAQPNMHSVGLFSYDNDYQGGIQVDEFKVYCRECESENMIGWWPMEDNLDDIIEGNNLTEVGDIRFGASNIAKTVGDNSTCKYAILDGSSYGQVDDSGHLNSEELAVSAWIYPKSYPNDANDNNGRDSLMSISSKDENYEFHINQNGELYWWWQNQNSASRSLTSSEQIPLNTWTHVAISYKAGAQRMYINGQLKAYSSYNELPKQSSCDYFIGADVATGSCSVIPERTFIGELDEVRIYGRYLSQSEIEQDMNLLRQCGLVNGVDHYKIIHPQTNLSCSATSVTVQACADESCAEVNGVDVTGDLIYTDNNQTSVLSALDLSNSPQQVEFDYTSLNTIVLGLSNMTPNAGLQCFYNNGTPSNCDITYQQYGYIVTANNIISSQTVSHPDNRVSVQAVEANAADPAVCVPSLVGQKNVNIDFSYINHPADHQAEPLLLSLDDTSYAEVQSGDGQQISLDFNNEDAFAYFYVRYPDAGTLNLSVSDPAGEVVSGYDSFNVIPNKLSLLLLDEDNQILGDTGNETHYAGKAFTYRIQALNAEGNITNNYRPGDLRLQAVMSSPLIAEGANSVTFSYGNGVIEFANQASWQPVSGLVFTSSGYINHSAEFNNVGNFNLDVIDADYLSYQINTDGPVSAGRFIPAYFSIDDVTSSPGIKIGNTRGGFSYIGEVLNYEKTPTFNYTAKTYDNTIATNYGKTSYKFINNAFDLTGRVYTEQNAVVGFSATKSDITVTGADNFDGVLQFSLADNFIYQKSANPVEPIPEVSIALDITRLDLMDDDGIGYDPNGINNSDSPVYVNYPISDINGGEVRYGRLRLENAYGDEAARLKADMVLEYWDGSKYVVNQDDSISEFSSYSFELSKVNPADPGSFVTETQGTKFDNGRTLDTNGVFVSNSDVSKSSATLSLKIINLPRYLNIDWNNDGVISSEDVVSSTIIFGSYRGNDRIIYKRER